jgi:SM-20-related protein
MVVLLNERLTDGIYSDVEVQALGDGGVVVRDGWLGDATARDALAEARELPFRAAQVRGGFHPELRGDELCWLDRHPATPALAKIVDNFAALAAELNRSAYLGLRRFEVQVARYAAGTAYAPHRDAFAGVTRSRVVTALYYLNVGWTATDGGVLCAGGQDIDPIADRLVVFLSEKVEHEVRPANALRYAVTAWYYAHD